MRKIIGSILYQQNFSLVNHAGIIFTRGIISTHSNSSSKGLISPSFNLKVAIDKVLNGAKVEGTILRVLMTTSEIFLPGFSSINKSDEIYDKIFKVIKMVNSGDNNNMRAYSTLVTIVWPNTPLNVSTYNGKGMCNTVKKRVWTSSYQ